jgi:hypothetical protein
MPMQWEYRKIDLNDVPRRGLDVDVLNQLGRDGWEIVAVMDNGMAYLKRPVGAARPSRKRASPEPSSP